MLLDIVIGMLAPHICVGCGQEGTLLCLECGEILSDPVVYAGDGNPVRVSAATSYQEFAKDLVWQLKFRGARAAAGVMARHMAPLIDGENKGGTGASLVPIPTANRRVRRRGFDQAKLLARHLSGLTGLRYHDCLRRHGQTEQVGASREQRLRQLEDAFRLKRAITPDSHMILVDDVMTTGATLEMAAAALKDAGAGQVDGVVFAQAD